MCKENMVSRVLVGLERNQENPILSVYPLFFERSCCHYLNNEWLAQSIHSSVLSGVSAAGL